VPVKKIDDLKDKNDRELGQRWQRELGLKDLTTRELDYICDYHQGETNEELRQVVLRLRAGETRP